MADQYLTRLGAAYELAWLGDMPVTEESDNRGHVSGEFEDGWFYGQRDMGVLK